jgi:hypothetical protein
MYQGASTSFTHSANTSNVNSVLPKLVIVTVHAGRESVMVAPWNEGIPNPASEIRYPPPVTISSELHSALLVEVPPGWTIGREGGGGLESVCLFSITLSGPGGPGGP